MNTKLSSCHVVMIVLVISMIAWPMICQEPCIWYFGMFSPPLFNPHVPCIAVSTPGTYHIAVDTEILIYLYWGVSPGCIVSNYKMTRTRHGVVKRAHIPERTIGICPNTLVDGNNIVFCFNSKRKGEETLTLMIDGEQFVYHFIVEDCPCP